ncbi:MBL fold metallo-hydrolase [Candidatus Latescibacterota bacterium]
MRKLSRLFVLVLIPALVVFIPCCQPETGPQTSTPQPSLEYERPAFEFTEVVEGVYCAQQTGNVPAWCNAAVIVNESDVIIVDTFVSPDAATALLEELKNITQKPVRYVINSHYHFDHMFGNEIFPDDVEIIGHKFARNEIASGHSNSGRAHDLYLGEIVPNQIASLREKLESVSDPTERAGLEKDISIQEKFLASALSVEPTAPNIAFKEEMTLYRGDREIRLLFLGRGHTGGDVVVHLPREGVLITGDLMYSGIPYMGNGYFSEWIETLEKLKEIEFDWIIPGHGELFQDPAIIDYRQSYLRDFWEQAQEKYKAGVSAQEAAESIDLLDHAEHYPQIQSVGVAEHAVIRAYELLDEGTVH